MNNSKITWNMWVSRVSEYGGGESNYEAQGTEREVLLETIVEYGPSWLQILMIDEQDCDNTVCVNRSDTETLEWAEEYFGICLHHYKFAPEHILDMEQRDRERMRALHQDWDPFAPVETVA